MTPFGKKEIITYLSSKENLNSLSDWLIISKILSKFAPKMSVLWFGEKCVGICKSSRF